MPKQPWLEPDEDAADSSESQLSVSRNLLRARIAKAASGSVDSELGWWPRAAGESVPERLVLTGRVLSIGRYLFVAGLARVRFWDVIARREWPEVWRLRLHVATARMREK